MGSALEICRECGVENTETAYLGWRAAAVASAPRSDAYLRSLSGGRTEDLLALVQKALASDALREPPPFITQMKPGEAPELSTVHSKAMIEWYLRRISATNRVKGPRCRLVWSGMMKELGRLPRWPDDARHILDAEKLLMLWLELCNDQAQIDSREFCTTMFSHRWERPSLDSKNAHPDDVANTKAKVLANYGELGACGVFPCHQFDYYYWIDFACVDQDDPTALVEGVCKLPLYVSPACELMFWDSPTTDYEPRAWTVERMIAFSFCFSPLMVYVGPGYKTRARSRRLDCSTP